VGGADDLLHVCDGRAFLRMPDTADLADNVELWREVWEANSEEALAFWLKNHPGERPRAFYEFASDEFPDQEEDECETAYLSRIGELKPGEIEALIQQAKSLAVYNAGRDPNKSGSNFCWPDDPTEWVCRAGLVDDETAQVLLQPYPDFSGTRVVRGESTNGVSH
jgi:hypothetical protein